MKLDLTEQQRIKDVLVGSKVSYGHYSYYNGAREVDRIEVIKDLYLKKYNDKSKWTIKTDHSEIQLADFCGYIKDGTKYKTQSKKIKDLCSSYLEALKKKDDQIFHNFIENMDDGKFNIKDVNISDEEIEWLKRHVTNITARFPSKYLKNFKKNFPDAEYILGENSWNYGFTMYFDDLTNIPDSLLNIKNSLGNSLDFDKKLMRNTSYIWKLVKNNPEFNFGKRNLSY